MFLNSAIIFIVSWSGSIIENSYFQSLDKPNTAFTFSVLLFFSIVNTFFNKSHGRLVGNIIIGQWSLLFIISVTAIFKFNSSLIDNRFIADIYLIGLAILSITESYFKINGRAFLDDDDAYDSTTVPGIYYKAPSTAGSPLPGTPLMLTVTVSTDSNFALHDRITQEAVTFNTAQVRYFRRDFDDTGWTAWVEYDHTGKLTEDEVMNRPELIHDTIMEFIPLDRDSKFYNLEGSTVIISSSELEEFLYSLAENVDELTCPNIASIFDGEYKHKEEKIFYDTESITIFDITADNVDVSENSSIVVVYAYLLKEDYDAFHNGLRFVPITDKKEREEGRILGFSPF